MRNAIKCTCIVLMLIAVIKPVTSVFSFKYVDGIYDVEKFYEQADNSIDVLALGSSHAFADINTAILWQDYGIAAYDLCGSIQPMWNTYHYLVEALKTQSPRLIVLEGYCLTFAEDYSDSSRIIKNTYGLKWSKNRIEALMASAPADEFLDYLFPYSQTHTRYTELSESDFRTNQGLPVYANWKGYLDSAGTEAFDQPNIGGITETKELTAKTEQYYRKILALANESNIPIVVVISPYAGITESDQELFNRGAEIAAEYGVNFYNYNLYYNSLGLDYATDCSDWGHLNYLGSAKYTRALGAALIDLYPDCYVDRRGDPDYISWELDSIYYNRSIYDKQIAQVDDIATAIALANDENYTILLSVSDLNDSAETVFDSLENRGIRIERECGAWILKGNDLIANAVEEFPTHVEPLKYDDLLITSSESEDETTYQFLLDDEDYTTVSDGVNLLIYDSATASIVTTMGY